MRHQDRLSFINDDQAEQMGADMAIQFMLGKRQVASAAATLQPNCTFSSQTTFAHKPGHGPKNRRVHLRVLVRFLGNGYLAPATRAHRITLG